MDDTLIFWETPPETVWLAAFQSFSEELGALEPSVLYQALRSVSDWYWSDPSRHRTGRLNLPEHRRVIGRMAFSKLNRNDFELADKIADFYSAERQKQEALVPGAIATLEVLRKRNLRLALVTNGNSEMQRGKIQKFGLAPLFDNILIEGEFGSGKPDESVFRHTLEKLNVSPADAWMVGDDLERDIAPCRALGIYTLWVDRRGNGLSDDGKVCPDAIIRNITEIPALL
jgi:putative hydrolase of the HAD superfamily